MKDIMFGVAVEIVITVTHHLVACNNRLTGSILRLEFKVTYSTHVVTSAFNQGLWFLHNYRRCVQNIRRLILCWIHLEGNTYALLLLKHTLNLENVNVFFFWVITVEKSLKFRGNPFRAMAIKSPLFITSIFQRVRNILCSYYIVCNRIWFQFHQRCQLFPFDK